MVLRVLYLYQELPPVVVARRGYSYDLAHNVYTFVYLLTELFHVIVDNEQPRMAQIGFSQPLVHLYSLPSVLIPSFVAPVIELFCPIRGRHHVYDTVVALVSQLRVTETYLIDHGHP